MRCLAGLTFQDRYATNRDDLVSGFYRPCYENSATYDRAVGYFRSSVLLLAAEPVARFALAGGRIRLVCSPELTEDDIDAVGTGYQWREQAGAALRRIIGEALGDAAGRPAVEFLATLVAAGCLDVRIAFRPGRLGIFHDKVGLFADRDGHVVSFTGSSNETFQGWDARGNHESFDVFMSWGADARRVGAHQQYFERLWNGQEAGVETVPFPDVARERLVAVANEQGIEAAYAAVDRARGEPRKMPRPHQVEALAAWERNGRRGILEHATASGKTITAITAIREWVAARRPTLVLVPSALLLAQWGRELRTELADLDIGLLFVGTGNERWRQRYALEGFTGPEGGPRVVVAMLQTAGSEQFLRRVQGGEHLLVVIDEVHRAGAPQSSRVFEIAAGARLGLSATPRRFGDPEGTARLLGYFGGVVHSFTLEDAMAAGQLCRYIYHVHPVELDQDEASRWRDLSARIRREVARSRRDEGGGIVPSEALKQLLIKRARILKQAAAKTPLAVRVVCDNFQPGDRWLVYCDDKQQLHSIVEALRVAGLPVDEYHSAMAGDQKQTMSYFTTTSGVLVAIRCLDEGVDIPAVDHALILASSRNPREFIQRRGRLLRLAEGKHFAEIHDAIVVPPTEGEEPDDVAIVRGELARARTFAQSASNDSVRFAIGRIAREHGLDLEGRVAVAGFEEEEDGNE